MVSTTTSAWLELLDRRVIRFVLGVSLGIAAAGLMLPTVERRLGGIRPLQEPCILSDCEGQIKELVIHYTSDASESVSIPYRDLLDQLANDVIVRVVCPDEHSYRDLVDRVGHASAKLSPVFVGHPITPWSRDRWLALAENGEAERGDTRAIELLTPRGEFGAERWPQRAGDGLVAHQLSTLIGPRFRSSRSELYFDGGDFVCDQRTAFVTPSVLRRNLQVTVDSRADLIKRLERRLGRKIVLLRDAPDHHAGMFMMATGDRTVLVGDPGLAQTLLADLPPEQLDKLCPPSGVDFSMETAKRFEAVAKQCTAEGYRVVRIPVLPGRDGRTYITHLNVILDQRDNERIVYMPRFAQASVLNLEAQRIWRELGFRVRMIDCTSCYHLGGSLRCLVSVLDRETTVNRTDRAPGRKHKYKALNTQL